MHFVPLSFENAEAFRASRWHEGGEGVTAFSHLDELCVGEDVILGIAVRGAGESAVMRGYVVWKRNVEDVRRGLHAGAGVRIFGQDIHRLSALEERVEAAR